MASQPKTFLTPEQYLEIERKAEYKSEYFQGETFVMAGGSPSHNQLGPNLIGELRPQTRGRCRLYSSDMRIRVPATGLYTYADVIAVCGKPQLEDDHRDVLLNPVLIVEVLSPSTESYDRGRKFEHYRSIETLQQYLLLSQDRVHMELFTRQPSGPWMLTDATGPDQTVELTSIGCRISLADVYEDVDLSDQTR